MRGKIHAEAAMLYYGMLATIPVTTSYLHLAGKVALACVAGAAIGGILADSDQENSLVNQANPSTKIVKIANAIFDALVKLIIYGGGGLLLLLKAKELSQRLTYIHVPYALYIPYILAVIMFFTAFTNKKVARCVPIVGWIYSLITDGGSKVFNFIKKWLIKLSFIGSATYLAYYNFNNHRDWVIYLACILLVGAALFPHRTFLHTPFGCVLFSIVAIKTSYSLGYIEIGIAFSIGYFSHLFLCDSLTESGIPLFYLLPELLKKLGLFKNKTLKQILTTKLRLPFGRMKTSTPSGNLYESVYIFLLIIALGFIIYKYQPIITIL